MKEDSQKGILCTLAPVRISAAESDIKEFVDPFGNTDAVASQTEWQLSLVFDLIVIEADDVAAQCGLHSIRAGCVDF